MMLAALGFWELSILMALVVGMVLGGALVALVMRWVRGTGRPRQGKVARRPGRGGGKEGNSHAQGGD